MPPPELEIRRELHVRASDERPPIGGGLVEHGRAVRVDGVWATGPRHLGEEAPRGTRALPEDAVDVVVRIEEVQRSETPLHRRDEVAVPRGGRYRRADACQDRPSGRLIHIRHRRLPVDVLDRGGRGHEHIVVSVHYFKNDGGYWNPRRRA